MSKTVCNLICEELISPAADNLITICKCCKCIIIQNTSSNKISIFLYTEYHKKWTEEEKNLLPHTYISGPFRYFIVVPVFLGSFGSFGK